MHDESVAETLLQTPDEIAVQLDGVQRRLGRREPLDQRLGQRREPRPDFDHALAALRRDRIDDRIDHALIDEKVLPETLAREMALMFGRHTRLIEALARLALRRLRR